MIGIVDDYDHNGIGVVKNNGKVVFVPYSILGEEIEYEIVKTEKRFDVGKLISVIQKSEYRLNPPCPFFEKCGACSFLFLDYEKQLEFKRNHVFSSLNRYAGIDVNVLPCIGGNKFAYRNKMAFALRGNPAKVVTIGTDKKSLIEINNCLLAGDWCEKFISICNLFFKKYNISAFDCGGTVFHVLARNINGTLMVSISSVSNSFAYAKELFDMLKKEFYKVGLELNTSKPFSANGHYKKCKHLMGEKSIHVENMGLVFDVSNESFLQVNDEMTKRLYNAVINECVKSKNIIDAYCGIGTLSCLMAKHVNSVYGIEIVEKAVENARNMAKINTISNVSFQTGDCANELVKALKTKKYDCVVLDPPRNGCDDSVLNALCTFKVEKIIYVSCEPCYLASNLKVLLNDYDIEKVQPFDMFPQTPHVETVCVLKCKHH